MPKISPTAEKRRGVLNPLRAVLSEKGYTVSDCARALGIRHSLLCTYLRAYDPDLALVRKISELKSK